MLIVIYKVETHFYHLTDVKPWVMEAILGRVLFVILASNIVGRGRWRFSFTLNKYCLEDMAIFIRLANVCQILSKIVFALEMSWWSNIVSGTRYSEWEAVPADKTTSINEIVEGKKFQIRTGKKIDNNYDIRWSLIGLRIEYFQFTTKWVHAAYCGGTGKVFTDEEKETKGFFRRAGVLTFLKTSTQLQIWFDGVLELTWIYDDNADKICVMRDAMEGLKFQAVYSGTHKDKVSTHYRYEIGKIIELFWSFQGHGHTT